jgi:hypothetical protein
MYQKYQKYPQQVPEVPDVPEVPKHSLTKSLSTNVVGCSSWVKFCRRMSCQAQQLFHSFVNQCLGSGAAGATSIHLKKKLKDFVNKFVLELKMI